MEKILVPMYGYRFAEVAQGVEIGHAYLYIMFNDRHERPYGLLEDLYVHEGHREGGIATSLHAAAFLQAKAHRCYKIIATSRNDGTRDIVHAWYIRLGYTAYGTEFRMDL